TYHYVNQWGGGMLVEAASTATIMDSNFAQSPGDFLTTQTNATVVMKYSQIGLDPAMGTDTTHCDTHFNGGSLTLVHSIIISSSYGSMFYGGQNAKFMYDNWKNTTNVDATAGAVSGDFSNGYFMGSQPPTFTGITATNLSPTAL